MTNPSRAALQRLAVFAIGNEDTYDEALAEFVAEAVRWYRQKNPAEQHACLTSLVSIKGKPNDTVRRAVKAKLTDMGILQSP